MSWTLNPSFGLGSVPGAGKFAVRTVIAGDSITAFNNAAPVDTGQFAVEGYVVWANVGLGGVLDIVKNAGVPGDRTSDLLARFQADVLANAPSLVIEMCGTNDIASPLVSGVPTVGAALNGLSAPVIAQAVESTVADIIDNKTAYYDAALAAGATVAALSITPSSDWLAYQHGRDIWARVTAWQRAFCTSNPGMIFVDAASPIIDGSSPASVPRNIGVDNDGLHYYTRSAQAVGHALEVALQSIVPRPASPLFAVDQAGANNPGGNAIPNVLWAGNGGVIDASVSATGTMPDGWQVNAIGGGAPPAVVLSRVPHETIPNMVMLQAQITFASVAGFQGVEIKPINPLAFFDAAAGDVIDWEYEFRVLASDDHARGMSFVMEDFTAGFGLLGVAGFRPTTITLPTAPMTKLGRASSGRRGYALGAGSALRYFKFAVYNSVNNVGSITVQLARLDMRKRV